MIRVQSQAFDPGFELSQLKEGRPGIGGTVMFLGTVRDLSEGADVKAMTLEHYPGMTEKALEDIEQEAHRRWPLDATLIIHRFGRLEPGGDGIDRGTEPMQMVFAHARTVGIVHAAAAAATVGPVA